MVFLMCVGVEAFKFVSLFVALLAKEKIIAVLAHPAIFHNDFFTIEALVNAFIIKARFNHHFKLVIASIILC